MRKESFVRCEDCKMTFMVLGQRGPAPKRCPPCREKRINEMGWRRLVNYRARKRKTTPPGRDRGGGSIDEGTEMISSPTDIVKYSKSIDRVRRGREGAARRPIALLGTPYCPKKRIRKVTILTVQEFTREYFK